MVTIEVFVAAFSSLAVIVAWAFFWVMTDIRSLRKEVREEFRAEADRQERRWEADRQERHTEREADKQERRAEREELRQEIRANTERILGTLYSHRHDPNTGEAVFYPPTQQAAD